MDEEKVKDKDAEKAKGPATASDLDKGLQDTFPGSDPISSLQPGSKADEGEVGSKG